MVLHLDHIYVKFEYQGHWVKVKVILWKMLILVPGHQFNWVWLVWGQGNKLSQGHTKVKVIPRSNCKCLNFYQQVGGGLLTERHSCWGVFFTCQVFLCAFHFSGVLFMFFSLFRCFCFWDVFFMCFFTFEVLFTFQVCFSCAFHFSGAFHFSFAFHGLFTFQVLLLLRCTFHVLFTFQVCFSLLRCVFHCAI